MCTPLHYRTSHQTIYGVNALSASASINARSARCVALGATGSKYSDAMITLSLVW